MLKTNPSPTPEDRNGSEIAVVGMACRFPGAETIGQYWRNLRDGVESLTELTDEELRAAGVPKEQIADPAYVRRASVIDRIEDFDAEFFGYTPLEATIMDPQHRLFMECAWEVLEQAGYASGSPSTVPLRGNHGGRVGVFTGAKTNTYLFQVVAQRARFPGLDNFQIALGNDLAAMATRLSYKFDLRGPSYAVHTACSTSLVAVHLACQSLLLDECTMAIAGGASVNVPQRRGYLYQKGGLLSPDGSCRTFDAGAAGSNFGNGCGAVLLKRLDDALADGDHVWAVIRGSATNNDGAGKASFTAPGVEGQTDVLLEAMAVAGVEAADLSYIEAHGTATELGDSIEMLALTQAFRASAAAGASANGCAIGSAKTNLGHLETAAGIAGLIKTALALWHRELPPSLHFEQPNSKIDFASSPFTVQAALGAWPDPEAGKRRLAGVSSFGIGSTNAHVILEEPPAPRPADADEGPRTLLLSARTESALETMSANLARRLEDDPEVDLADVAYTLAVGRRRFAHRRAVVAGDAAAAARCLVEGGAGRRDLVDDGQARPVVFLLPGLGDQRVDLARGLYDGDATFRAELDRAFEILEPLAGDDLRAALYPGGGGRKAEPDLKAMLRRGAAAADPAAEHLAATRRSQPLLFAVEHALARMWTAWGVTPKSLLGFSLGEYVAACLAGVLRLEDALELVVGRARLLDELEPGAMLGVSLGEDELRPLLGERLSLAAVNGPGFTVASGPVDAIDRLAAELEERGVAGRRLATTHAFHSHMMEEAAGPFRELVAGFELSAPEIPYISNVTGTWITAGEATDPDYWVRHLCGPVRFGDGVATLFADGQAPAMLEMGTGQSLATFVKLHPAVGGEGGARVAASLPGAFDELDDLAAARAALGRLWTAGADVDWTAHFDGQRRRRVPLPTYPFERRRLWLDPVTEEVVAGGPAPATRVTLDKQEKIVDWFYQPVWREVELPETESENEGATLVFSDGGALADALVARLRDAGRAVFEVTAVPGSPDGYGELLADLHGRGVAVSAVLHLWSLGAADFDDAQERGFYSLLFLAQALGRGGFPRRGTNEDVRDPVAITAVTERVHRVTGSETLRPELATILGPARVVPQEMPGIRCRAVDVDTSDEVSELAAALLGELAVTAADPSAHDLVAWRGGRRYQQDFERLPVGGSTPLVREGVYLVTGGLGGLGLALAEHLARSWAARLVLVGRSAFPEPDAWDTWIDEHGPDDPGSVKIATLRAMEAAGGEVLVLSADAADREAMAAVRAKALERFGRVDGVVHTAGIPGGGIVQLKTRDMAETILRPKVGGARALAEVFAADDLDFLLIYSSVASILGEFGQVDYCGANAFLDAFAQSCVGAAQGPPVRVVNWDLWSDVGLAVYTEVPPHLRPWREEMISKGIRTAEGLEVFERVLGAFDAERRQVVISTQDFRGRIELGKSFTGERFLAELGMAPAAPARVAETATPAAGLDGPRLERRIAEIWREVLGVEVRVDDNFFDLGGNSLVGLQLVQVLNSELDVRIAPVELFEHPSVSALAGHLQPAPVAEAPAVRRERGDDEAVAVVGMAGRFPGAGSVDELWENLREGVESVRFFTDDELLGAGVPRELIDDPKYVRAGSVIDGIDLFDAALFGYSPREAEVMDPQQRIFLECAWEALETAAIDPERYPGRVGVFAGANLSTYLLKLYADPAVVARVNMLQAILGNDKDALTTRVSYKLDLRGPSIGVQTFCSTSLVAVHMAARSLLDGDCDAALAGGIRVVVPAEQGYLFEERGIAPRDGHTRSFDAGATGAVLGNGVGAVVLKRLADARADGDPIRAVILGTAINNDGGMKAGYTAPSVDGQVQVARAALERAGVDPATVSYLEAHGSATELGDPIEVTALGRAYAGSGPRAAPCALGSIKSNFGHLDRAAGVAGLIKTVLALEHGEIPPSLNYERPNPQIDFASSPFQVQTALGPWAANGAPRRAAVNSLGMGGTNVHVILEEAPEEDAAEAERRDAELLVLSAHSPRSLDDGAVRLAELLERRPEVSLGDVAHTLGTGRRQLRYRRALVARDAADAAAVLRGGEPRRLLNGFSEKGRRSLVFLFPGLGGQYVDMGRGLYGHEPVFRDAVDRCAARLEPLLGLDLREVMFPRRGTNERYPAGSGEAADAAPELDLRGLLRRGGDEESPEARRLARTVHAQPALFVTEWALAELWRSQGFEPAALLGYSIGEYVAACLAGVLTLDDALTLVARRARLIEALPEGGMLAVALAAEEAERRLESEPELAVAALNTPEQTVVAGPSERLDAFAESLDAEGISSRRLQVSHAFHSPGLRGAFDDLVELARGFELSAPEIPFVSNVTGTWMSDDDAVDPSYWARHMCGPVRFSAGLETLLDDAQVFLEVGPPALSSLVLQHPAAGGDAAPAVVPALRHAFERGSDIDHGLSTVGKLWLAGLDVDWARLDSRPRRRLVLPTYAFDRQRYWIETRAADVEHVPAPAAAEEERTAPAPVEPAAYSRPNLRTGYVAPRNATETALAELWHELLGVGEVGVHDNFLELGGDSLLASRMITRMRVIFELDVPIRLFFEASTIAELAGEVDRLRREEEERELAQMVGQMSDEEIELQLAELQQSVNQR